jgi:hypothetical protein
MSYRNLYLLQRAAYYIIHALYCFIAELYKFICFPDQIVARPGHIFRPLANRYSYLLKPGYGIQYLPPSRLLFFHGMTDI